MSIDVFPLVYLRCDLAATTTASEETGESEHSLPALRLPVPSPLSLHLFEELPVDESYVYALISIALPDELAIAEGALEDGLDHTLLESFRSGQSSSA